MLFLRFRTELSPDEINARFEHWRDYEDHSQWKLFQTFTNPRIGFHVLENGKKISGYYEDGERNRGDCLKSDKVWFEIEVAPCKEGTKLVGNVHSSPASTFFLWMIVAAMIGELLIFGSNATGFVGLPFILLIAGIELHEQYMVKKSLFQLIPSIRKHHK